MKEFGGDRITFREFVIQEFPDVLEIMGYNSVSHYASAGIVEDKQMSWYYHTYPDKEIEYPPEAFLQEIHNELTQRARALKHFRRGGGIESNHRYCIKKGNHWYQIIWSLNEKELLRNEYGPYRTPQEAMNHIPLSAIPLTCVSELTGEKHKELSLYERIK
ncbi:MAG TPA: hypothetical protein P5107_02700 [Thermotogota bacterium]|nr:hypothetical protein [Thermotogota bacterium]HRW33947.1 hypothetical protein [Thermotogota bacterium]